MFYFYESMLVKTENSFVLCSIGTILISTKFLNFPHDSFGYQHHLDHIIISQKVSNFSQPLYFYRTSLQIPPMRARVKHAFEGGAFNLGTVSYLKAKIDRSSREACHRPDHMSAHDTGLLKVGQNIETEAGQNAAPRRHNNDPLANQIVPPFQLPLGNLSMSDVHATGD